MKINILIIFVLFTGFTYSQSFNQTWVDANKAYNNKEYDTAISLYDSIAKTNNISAELLYNLGNAYYKTNQLGLAILHYEKALKINPNDENIQHNLEFCNQLIIDKTDPSATSPITTLLFSNGSKNYYAAVVSILFALITLTCCVYIIRSFNKKVFYTSLGLSVILALIFVGLAIKQHQVFSNQSDAIIIDLTANVKTEPNQESSIAFILHEGSKVEITEQHENWSKITFNKKNVGWIDNSTIEII